jgi:HSP20 family protein
MFGLTRSNPIEAMLDFHSNFDRLFNQFWNDLPSQTVQATSSAQAGFQVRSTDDAWKVSVPMPGIDPKYVSLDVSGNSLSIRAEQPESQDAPYARFEQTIAVPTVVDMENIKAAYRFGVLELTLPWKASVKPRRIQIETTGTDQKQIHAVAS